MVNRKPGFLCNPMRPGGAALVFLEDQRQQADNDQQTNQKNNADHAAEKLEHNPSLFRSN